MSTRYKRLPVGQSNILFVKDKEKFHTEFFIK